MRQKAFHDSAHKHGYSDEEILAVWESWEEELFLDDDKPGRLLRIGFDSTGHPVEVIGIVFDWGERVLFIHAMPLQRSTARRIGRLRN